MNNVANTPQTKKHHLDQLRQEPQPQNRFNGKGKTIIQASSNPSKKEKQKKNTLVRTRKPTQYTKSRTQNKVKTTLFFTTTHIDPEKLLHKTYKDSKNQLPQQC